jgi:hypothetical protein
MLLVIAGGITGELTAASEGNNTMFMSGITSSSQLQVMIRCFLLLQVALLASSSIVALFQEMMNIT